MNNPKSPTHLRIVPREAPPAISRPHENASCVRLEIAGGMLVTCQVDARSEDCGELLRGIVAAQRAILRKMQGA